MILKSRLLGLLSRLPNSLKRIYFVNHRWLHVLYKPNKTGPLQWATSVLGH
jgi:hypothetical protein